MGHKYMKSLAKREGVFVWDNVVTVSSLSCVVLSAYLCTWLDGPARETCWSQDLQQMAEKKDLLLIGETLGRGSLSASRGVVYVSGLFIHGLYSWPSRAGSHSPKAAHFGGCDRTCQCVIDKPPGLFPVFCRFYVYNSSLATKDTYMVDMYTST